MKTLNFYNCYNIKKNYRKEIFTVYTAGIYELINYKIEVNLIHENIKRQIQENGNYFVKFEHYDPHDDMKNCKNTFEENYHAVVFPSAEEFTKIIEGNKNYIIFDYGGLRHGTFVEDDKIYDINEFNSFNLVSIPYVGDNGPFIVASKINYIFKNKHIKICCLTKYYQIINKVIDNTDLIEKLKNEIINEEMVKTEKKYFLVENKFTIKFNNKSLLNKLNEATEQMSIKFFQELCDNCNEKTCEGYDKGTWEERDKKWKETFENLGINKFNTEKLTILRDIYNEFIFDKF